MRTFSVRKDNFSCAKEPASPENNRELTNRRLSHDDAVGLRDMPTAHAFVGSCRRRAKVDDVVLSKFTASPKQKNVR